MSQIQAGGGQPQKQPKFAPIYTGRFFNGLYTNRSPLRAATASHIYEKFYSDTSGDAMITGSNLEVSNRLTLVRRPGNPLYGDGHTYNHIDSFDEFRVNKAVSDVFGTTLEQIFTMVDAKDYLYSLTDANNGFKRGSDASYNYGLKYTKESGAGQSYMQAVGNSLYWGDGVSNKKWLTSLFQRTTAGNGKAIQGADGLAGTYPFGTYLIDPATGNIQQFIGITIGTVQTAAVSSGILTLTVTTNSVNWPASPVTLPQDTYLQIWGMTNAANLWMNGQVFNLAAEVTSLAEGTASQTLTFYTSEANYTTATESGGGAGTYIIQTGTNFPCIALTDSTSVPTWGTTVPSTSNNFLGSQTLDGNTVWQNRGFGTLSYMGTAMNWGIKAPTSAIATSVTGTTTEGWKRSTYYSAAGIMVDANGNFWQVTTPGTTGATDTFPATPSVGDTYTSGTAVFTAVAPSASSGAAWTPHTLESEGAYSGSYPWPTSTPEDGAFLPDWKSGKFVVATSGGVPCLFTLQKNIPQYNVNVPISVVYGGGTPGHTGWTCQFFNHSQNAGPVGSSFDLDWGGAVGSPVLYGTSTIQSSVSATDTSLLWNYYSGSGTNPMQNYIINGAGEVSGSAYTVPWSGMPSITHGYEFCQYGKIRIPVDNMNVTFTILANSTCFMGIESAAGATLSSFSITAGGGQPQGPITNKGFLGTRTLTPWNGYPIIAGSCGPSNEYGMAQVVTINFPTAGVYGVEFDYSRGYGGEAHPRNYFMVVANGSHIVPEQSTTQPWFESTGTTPLWGSAGWNLLSAANNTYPSVLEVSGNGAISWTAPENGVTGVYNGNQLRWYNLGPISDFAFVGNTPVTLPSTLIVDVNSNEQRPYQTGVSSSTTAPNWQTSIYSLTGDQAPLQWINEGSIPSATGAINTITATSAQGWLYWIALVNTLDQTVSNLSPISLGTGPVVGGQITIPPGSGLNLSTIDPQADYAAIFRSADGFTTPILIPGYGNSPYTVPLSTYLLDGYVDTTPDADLNTLLEGPLGLENTPPGAGAVNLTYHLSRIWYSIGNTVYWTTGPLAPIGNGTDGVAPGNYSTCASQVRRLVPTAIGMLVYTISDVYIIAGNGTVSSPIQPAIPYLPGVGLGNYNALDINGGLIGFMTTDRQMVAFNPSAGLSYAGFNIGDQFRLNNGTPGQSWNPTEAYIAFHINGEDVGWYTADGTHGWYRLINTPAPEAGSVSWSPFANIQSLDGSMSPSSVGVTAIKSVETSPGVHNLLIGQDSAAGYILSRDLNATSDGGSTGSNGSTYPAYGVIGSVVLANAGQIAKIAFITTESVYVGSPLTIGVILNEALPYYKGSFDILKHWVSDPPGLPPSKSFYAQRFYLSELGDGDDGAYCRHLQILVQWPAEAAANELQTLTIFGAYEVEA